VPPFLLDSICHRCKVKSKRKFDKKKRAKEVDLAGAPAKLNPAVFQQFDQVGAFQLYKQAPQFLLKTIKSVGRQTGRVVQRQQGKVGAKNMGAAVDKHKRGRESVSDLLKREKKTGDGLSRGRFFRRE
jgi:hypothetical protein